jgi:heme oxygenase
MNAPADEKVGFAARLWSATKALHVQAERSGMMARILRGRASREGYALMLRNLLPAYEAMEQGLAGHAGSASVGLFALPETYRATALRSDLTAIAGDGWEADLALLPEAAAYAAAVTEAADGTGEKLIAHAYTRYLGDLSGGQIMQTVLTKTLGLGPEALGFYRFEGIADIAAFKQHYHADLDLAGDLVANPLAVLAAAQEAFRHNMAISEAIDALQNGSV